MHPAPLACPVIAIAAPIGGGKSALAAALREALPGSAALHFDDHETATRQPAAQLAEWLASGADFSRLEAPGLAERLAALQAIGASCVVFEMPLGRAWPATATAIDLLVWIDVPLDIALARRMLDVLGHPGPDATGWLREYLPVYIDTLHGVLQAQARVVRPQADLVLDGQQAIPAMVAQVLAALPTTKAADAHA